MEPESSLLHSQVPAVITPTLLNHKQETKAEHKKSVYFGTTHTKQNSWNAFIWCTPTMMTVIWDVILCSGQLNISRYF